MNASTDEADPTAVERSARLVAALRPLGALLGLALLIAAVVVVIRSRGTLAEAASALRSADASSIAILLSSVLGSVVLTGTVFWMLTRRFGPLPFLEMQALMAATTLANYLPLRPGLIARVLVHRVRHGIRARDALRTIVEAMAMSTLALALLVPSSLLGFELGMPVAAWVAIPAMIGCAGLIPRRSRVLAGAWLLRYFETLLTALRYHLAFALLGTPVPPQVSIAIACVSMMASLVPIVSNGIGLREWAIGLLAPLLAGYSMEQGIAAELLNRAAEIAVVVPTGILGGLWMRKLRPSEP